MNKDELKALIREVLGEMENEPHETSETPEIYEDVMTWTEALNGVDWLRVVKDVRDVGVANWGDFCVELAVALENVNFSDVPSLDAVVEGIKTWLDHQSGDYGVDWNDWLDALIEYLEKERAEPDGAVTWAEFCEALAATIQSHLAGELRRWVSPNQVSPRVPVHMGQVAWYLSLLLYRVPIWFGEGIGAGEEIPKHVDPWAGGDTPWSMPT